MIPFEFVKMHHWTSWRIDIRGIIVATRKVSHRNGIAALTVSSARGISDLAAFFRRPNVSLIHIYAVISGGSLPRIRVGKA